MRNMSVSVMPCSNSPNLTHQLVSLIVPHSSRIGSSNDGPTEVTANLTAVCQVQRRITMRSGPQFRIQMHLDSMQTSCEEAWATQRPIRHFINRTRFTLLQPNEFLRRWLAEIDCLGATGIQSCDEFDVTKLIPLLNLHGSTTTSCLTL